MADILHGGSLVAEVEVRVLTREHHNLTSKVTRYAVENGATISDHLLLEPNTVDVQFEMTNTDRGVEQARQVAQEFISKREKRDILTLDTEHLRYKNIVIEKIDFDHSAPNKGAYKGTLRLVQIGIVGESDMVSTSGGRAPGVLAGDGTKQTACNYASGGNLQPIVDQALVGACQKCLARSM